MELKDSDLSVGPPVLPAQPPPKGRAPDHPGEHHGQRHQARPEDVDHQPLRHVLPGVGGRLPGLGGGPAAVVVRHHVVQAQVLTAVDGATGRYKLFQMEGRKGGGGG